VADAKFDAILNLGIFLAGITFMAFMYWRSPAWRETIRDLFGRGKK
jgi:hypothetical protein